MSLQDNTCDSCARTFSFIKCPYSNGKGDFCGTCWENLWKR